MGADAQTTWGVDGDGRIIYESSSYYLGIPSSALNEVSFSTNSDVEITEGADGVSITLSRSGSTLLPLTVG